MQNNPKNNKNEINSEQNLSEKSNSINNSNDSNDFLEKNNSFENEKLNENSLSDRKERLRKSTEQLQEQIDLIREQIAEKREMMQVKTQLAMENAKNQIVEITQKIEREIDSIKQDAKIIETELLDSQKKEIDRNISFVQELARKTVHLMSLAIPICYVFFSMENMLMVLVPIMFLAIISDLATKRIVFLRSIYLKAFGFLLRKHEIKTKKILLNGASWVMIASVLTIYFFPKIIAIIALSILIISDLIAAVIGRKFGKYAFLGLKKKSWEGTVAFFVSAMLVVTVYGIIFNVPIPFYFIGLIASLVAAISEAIAKKILRTDDNLAIPISFGITMWTGNAFLIHFYSIDCINLLL